MELTPGIIEIDLHGLRVEEAVSKVKREVAKAPKSVYSIRLIHGYHGGTRIRDAIEDEFSYGRDSRVKSVRAGGNQGITELVLR
ncbi:MAG: Smr/MutS family protein [Lachnospiraceae bacterium]|nr:Smr/MutS family protein [Lachnospiraceae bacterium]